MKTDIQFIEAIKLSNANRKRTAIITVVLVIAIIVLNYFIYKIANTHTLEQIELYIPQYAGTLLTDADLKHIAEATDFAYRNGFALGIFLGAMLLLVISLLTKVFYYPISNRKDLLLIKYHEQTKT